MAIIGILGLIGSGKNTAAEEFVKLGYEQDSFAASLKDATAAIFGWPRHLLEGDTPESRAFREQPDMFWHDKLGEDTLAKLQIGPGFPDKYFTPRLALQKIGTDVFRNMFHDDIWINTFEKRISNDPNRNVVISDVRFKNEIALIRQLGGTLIRVDRGERPDWYGMVELNNAEFATPGERMLMTKCMAEEYSDVHSSEWDWVGTEVDHVIDNNKTIIDLKQAVSEIANDIRRNPGRAAVKNEKIITDVASLYT
jgi:hypothetical protein